MPGISKTGRKRGRLKEIMHGLTEGQRAAVRAALPQLDRSNRRELGGWSIYRSPTTIHPPTTLRVLHRDGDGRLLSVTRITEHGRTLP